MGVEEIAITAEYTTAIGSGVLDAFIRGAFHEATERLHRNFILLRIFRLRKCRQRRGGDARNPREDQFLSKHLINSFVLLDAGFLTSTSVRIIQRMRNSNRP